MLEDELPSSILLHDGWLYLSGRGTVRRYKQSKPRRRLRHQGGHRPGLLRLPSPSGLRPDHRQRRLAVHHLRRRRQLRRRLRRQPGDRAAHRGDLPLPARRLEDAHLLAWASAIPTATSPSTTAGNMFHADNDNEDGSKFTGCRLMHVAEGADFGWRLRAGAALLRARPRPRRRLRRTARQDAAAAQDRPRLARRPAHLQRHPLPRALSRPALLSRRLPQADPRLQGRARRRDVRGRPTNSSS